MNRMAKSEVFGAGPDGETVTRVFLAGGGLSAKVLTWGAIIQDLRLEGHAAPLVLGFENMPDYLAHSPYFGATPGRAANRIAKGRITIDGQQYQLDQNEDDVTHLHGGRDGIGNQNWDVVELTEDKVVLRIVDPDGRAGYPGNCTVTATYQLKADGVLSVIYESTTDAPTVANVCQHSYFSLKDGADTSDHLLMIAADAYLPTDAEQIPEGGPKAVEGTAFDFRNMKPMVQVDGHDRVLFDHNFCLSSERTEKRLVAHVASPASGVHMRVLTTEPGVQFYAAFKMDVPVPGLDGLRYPAFSGFCLETQVWPDAVNQAGFPQAILRPGTVLRQETDYVFERVQAPSHKLLGH
jgi:aldose 1-epimerase